MYFICNNPHLANRLANKLSYQPKLTAPQVYLYSNSNRECTKTVAAPIDFKCFVKLNLTCCRIH